MTGNNDLTHFLSPSPERLKILTVDSTPYLEKLAKLYPNADIYAVTGHEEVEQEYRLAKPIEWQVLDWRLSKFPFAEDSFDIIIAESAMEYAYEPYDTLMMLNRLLKPTGTLYTMYSNIRYQGVLSWLRQGLFPVRDRRLYAKHEVVRLLNDTLFKEIIFAPAERDDDMTLSGEWAELGFDNFSEDLATKLWLVKASRSTASVSNLKLLYNHDVRQQLARLLHRIEYDVERQKNLVALQAFCSHEGIFADYVDGFIEEVCVHKDLVRKLLAESTAKQYEPYT